MIKKLLGCRRGGVAVMFGIVAIPMIGLAALATEGGVWYVAKRTTQNAADSAAFAAALRLVYTTDTMTVDERGRQFAAQNGYCPGGSSVLAGANCLPLNGSTHAVLIEPGTYSGPGTFTPTAVGSATAVRATVSQTQPSLLASVFQLLNGGQNGPLTIASRAIASVENPGVACVLGLGGPAGLTIGGNAELRGGNCTLKSNTGVNINGNLDGTFNGTGWAVDGVTGCVKGDAATCDIAVSHNYYSPPAANPFADITPSLFTSNTATVNPCPGSGACAMVPNGSGTPYGGFTISGTVPYTMAAGTYVFRNANIRINGGSLTGQGPVNIVLLGTSTISMNGNGVVNLTAGTTTANPSQLDGVLIYQAGTGDITINGKLGSSLGGAIYAPNADLTLSGTAATTNDCFYTVARTVTIQGNYLLDTTGCPPSRVPTTQLVVMVE